VAGPVAVLHHLLLVELWLSFIYGSYNGAMVVYLTEIMPAAVRTAGFSLAYSLATAIFGGMTPAVATYLIHTTGDRAAAGWWLSAAALLGLVAALLTHRFKYAVWTRATGVGPEALPPVALRPRRRRRRARLRPRPAAAR